MRFHSALKTYSMFSVHTNPKKLKTQKSPAILDLDGKHHDIVTSSFSKASGVFKFLQFEERFRDGLVWTVGLQTVEIKLRFEISLA